MAMMENYLATEPPREDVDALPGPAVLEFGAPWCGFCMRAQPLIAAAFRDHPQVRHIKVEDGSGRPLGRSFRVKLWPTLIFLRDGKEVSRLVRCYDRDEIARAFLEIDAAGTAAD